MNRPENELQNAWKRLNHQWEESKNMWNDRIQAEFETRYLQSLTREAYATSKEIDHLIQMLQKVRHNVK